MPIILTSIFARLHTLLRRPSAAHLYRWYLLVARISALSDELKAKPDADLRQQSLSLRYRARSGENLTRLLPEAFALVREAARRTIKLCPYDVQVLGAIALHDGCIAEMETGEGKTLAATMPLYLNSLKGKGAVLATANDYLAKRDAEWMGPIYKLLGLTVGVIQSLQPHEERRAAYACDITYGTAKEFGFDFLRDQLLRSNAIWPGLGERGAGYPLGAPCSAEQPVQRGLHYCIVDEADSLLIDEARTPLIIGVAPSQANAVTSESYGWAAGIAGQFQETVHYQYTPKEKSVTLTPQGHQLARTLQMPRAVQRLRMTEICERVQRAILAARDFHRDRHYVVRDGQVVIIDEFTGRPGEGRKWQDGIHQAIEAKEGVQLTEPTGLAAQVTVQELFKQFDRLAGMTGTARTSAREFRKVFGLRVAQIPTNRPIIRNPQPHGVFDTADQKWRAITNEIVSIRHDGRPVLIGTRSIDKSEHLSHLLQAAGVEHQLLNARHLAAEAEIIAAAGQAGKVTVATNLAGRGTDICLGEGVAALGGLHVICSEMHEAARIDRQLVGRCGRQGDPGSYRIYISLEDDLLSGQNKGVRNLCS